MASKKEKRDFENISLIQTLARHNGTIWTMKFSHDGARLVTGGQDAILRVWKVDAIVPDVPQVPLSKLSGGSYSSTVSAAEKNVLKYEPDQAYQVELYLHKPRQSMALKVYHIDYGRDTLCQL